MPPSTSSSSCSTRRSGSKRRTAAVAVETESGPVGISYGQLVVALGSISRTLPIPGLREHGRGFKDLADAIELRNHVLRRLEAADAGDGETAERQLTFVFVGAG